MIELAEMVAVMHEVDYNYSIPCDGDYIDQLPMYHTWLVL